MYLLGALGFLLLVGIMIILFWGKFYPALAFVIPPIIVALLLGYNITEIGGMIQRGIGTVQGTAVLFMFSIPFFGIMNEKGVFDPIVDWLVSKAGTNMVMITIATVLIAIVSHLDGSAASTALITVPAMLPLYKKMNMRPHILVLLIAISSGTLNIVPWGGPTLRAAAMLGMDPNDVWLPLIPIQIVGFAVSLGAAIYFGLTEKRHSQTAIDYYAKSEVKSAKVSETDRVSGWKLWFNWALIVILVLTLAMSWMPAATTFLVGLVLAILVNYSGAKNQSNAVQRQSEGVITVATVLLASGALVGILTDTYMIEHMGSMILSLIPEAMGAFYYHIVGAIAGPIAIIFGTDAYFFGLQPIITEVGAALGHDPVGGAHVLLMGHNSTVLVSPFTPAMFLLIGLAGVDLKDHLRFSIPWGIGLSWVFVVAGFILGIL